MEFSNSEIIEYVNDLVKEEGKSFEDACVIVAEELMKTEEDIIRIYSNN